MENIKLNPTCGSMFGNVAKEAQNTATDNQNCEFDFNGIKCVVDQNTNLDSLYRDYKNAWTMEWKTVGPNCVEEYHQTTINELKRRNDLSEAKAEIERKARKEKEDAEKKCFEDKIKGVKFDCIDLEKYNSWKDKNKDGYGAATFRYAEGWAKLMQLEMSNGEELKDIAEKTSFEMDFMGISGAMYGFSVGILSECWVHGKKLRDAVK